MQNSEELEMCDYSPQGLPTRLACEGELLVTYRFPNHLVGMASALDIDEAVTGLSKPKHTQAWWSAVKRRFAKNERRIPAVCIPPGARLRMTHIPAELRDELALRPVEDVWFTLATVDPDEFRDAIRLGNGRVILLQTLPERICFLVLSLGSDDDYTQVQMPVWPDEVPFLLNRRTA